MMQKEISINISGDFYLNTLSSDERYFSNDILDIFNNSDFNIINLESPVTGNKENKIIKTGPNLSGSLHTFSYLKQLKINLVTLANNHLMDYGIKGLSDTISGCRENLIEYVGAGMSLEEAEMPFVPESIGLKISIINFTENEWSTASGNKPGANPLNIIENVRQIRRAKETSDLVLVIIHGGHEMYHLRSPRMVNNYRFYAENGASMIICHHSHSISGFEVYKNVPVFYGLGNFLFTEKSAYESWYTGLILNIRIKRDMEIKWELIPIRQNKDTYALSVLQGGERQNVLSEVKGYSEIISNEKLLLENWENFIREKYDEKIDIFSPIQFFNSTFIIKALRKTGLNRFLRRRKHYAQILNHMRCESLSDLSKSVIARLLGM